MSVTFYSEFDSLSEEIYSKTYVKRPLKNRQNKNLDDKW